MHYRLPQLRTFSYVDSPPRLRHLRDAGVAALCGCAGMWLLLARVWLCGDL